MSLLNSRCFIAVAAIGLMAARAGAVPVSTYSLNEPVGTVGAGSVIDSVSGLNGTPVGTVTFGAQSANPNTGTSASFAGTGNIDVPFNAALNPAAFTVSAWAKVQNGSSGVFRSVVTDRNDPGESIPAAGTQGYILYAASDNTWQFWTGSGTAAWNTLTGPAVNNGVWTHLAATFDGTTKRLFVNGALAASAAQTYVPNVAEAFHIGGGGDAGTSFRFNGQIDDVRVFNSALALSEIQNVMNAGESVNISLGKTYSYSTLPTFSGGTFYLDDTHVQAVNTFSTGQLTNGLTMPSAGDPTSPVVNEIAGWGDPASVGTQIIFDLGTQFGVDRVRLGTHTFAAFANGAPDGVQVSFSNTGTAPGDFGAGVAASFLSSQVPSNGHWDLDVNFAKTTARFVKLTFDGGAILSGNTANKWNLDEVTIFGTTIPEPASLALLAFAALPLAMRRRRA